MKFKGIGVRDGTVEEIEISAESRDDAYRQMSEMGYKEISVVQKAGFFQQNSVSNKELGIVFRQLASFASAGETFLRSLTDVADVTKNKTLQEALLDIRSRIEMGTPIPVAFSQHSIFPPVVVNLLRVGDESGEMETVLDELAQYLEQIADINDGVNSALMYPKILTTIMMIAGIFLVTYVLPQFRSFYTSMKMEMPFMTKLLYAISDFLRNDWMIAIPGLLAIGFLLKNLKQYMPMLYDNIIVSLPIVKGIMINMYMFRFCKTLQILTQSNIQILDALELTRDTLENHLYTDVLDKTIPLVRIGESISSSMRRNDPDNRFDVMAMAFLSTGEETNNIPELMDTAAQHYQKILKMEIENFGKQLEPILLVGIALFVFALAASVYLPIFRMSQMGGQR